MPHIPISHTKQQLDIDNEWQLECCVRDWFESKHDYNDGTDLNTLIYGGRRERSFSSEKVTNQYHNNCYRISHYFKLLYFPLEKFCIFWGAELSIHWFFFIFFKYEIIQNIYTWVMHCSGQSGYTNCFWLYSYGEIMSP